MAQKLVYIDDLTGEEGDGVRPCKIAYENIEFRADFGDETRAQLIEALAPFLQVAQRIASGGRIPDELRPHAGSPTTGHPAPKAAEGSRAAQHAAEVQELKMWLRRMGVKEPHAKIPNDIWAAFRADDPGLLKKGRLPVHDEKQAKAG